MKKNIVSLLFILGFIATSTICVMMIMGIKDKEEVSTVKGAVFEKVTIEQIKTKYESQLLNIEGVVGVGIGEEIGKPVIKVYVIKKTKALQEKIPAQIEGVAVSIEVTGEFHAL